MTTMEIAQIAGGAVISLGIFAGGVGYLMQAYKKSGREERKDVTDSADTISEFWKKQAEELKLILQTKDTEFNAQLAKTTKEFNEKIQDLVKQVGILTGQLTAEKAANDRFEKIFQGRNPEMEEFMKFMVQSAKESQETHEKIIEVLTDLHKTSSSNHAILDSRKQSVEISGEMKSSPVV